MKRDNFLRNNSLFLKKSNSFISTSYSFFYYYQIIPAFILQNYYDFGWNIIVVFSIKNEKSTHKIIQNWKKKANLSLPSNSFFFLKLKNCKKKKKKKPYNSGPVYIANE